MNNQEKGKLDNQSNVDLESQEILNITQRLVKEFIDTKQRMSTDDRKLNAIGKALIAQNEMLNNILQGQDNRGNQLTNSLVDISNRQEDLVKCVFGIKDSILGLDEAQAEQEKFVQNLNNFQERHNELVNKSSEQSDQSIERLESINEQIENLFTQVGEVDIENRVVDIADRTAEINEMIATHAQKQEDAREDASKKMLDLLSEVTLFRQELSDEGFIGKLDNVQSVSDANNKMIDNLNEKFDIFVEIYEISKVESINDLEELFTTSSNDSTDDDMNVLFADTDANNIDDEEEVVFDEINEELVDESDEIQFEESDDIQFEESDDIQFEESDDIQFEEIDEDVITQSDPEFSYYKGKESEEVEEELYNNETEDVDKRSYEEIYQDETYGNNNEEYTDEEYTDEEYTDNMLDEDLEDETVELGNDMEISEFKRVERESDSIVTADNADNKGFFSKLFGGR